MLTRSPTRLGLCAAVAAAITCGAAAQTGPGAPSVTVAAAKIVKMSPKMSLPGTVMARNDSHLAAEVEGRVAWVAEVGTVVRQGDPVAKLDTSMLALQLASDQANVARLSAAVRYDRAQAIRMQRLLSASAIAKSTADQAVAQRDQDAAALAQAQAELARTKHQLDTSDIRAPFPGRVVQRLIQTGEYATPGKEIVRLVETDAIEVSAQVPMDSAAFVKEGMTTTVRIANRYIAGTVRAIVPVGDDISRTMEIRVTLPQGSALVGDAATVLIPSAASRNVLAVPRDALVLREDNTYIFKVDGKNIAQRIAVETGSEDGALVEIRGLIKPGDHVVIAGAERLEAGQKVRAIMASRDGGPSPG